MGNQVDKERQRYLEWIEENPPLKEDGGWLCPQCDNCHNSEDDAIDCCMPDEQDADDYKHHNRR